MTSEQFKTIAQDKLTFSISLKIGNRNKNLPRNEMAGKSPDELKSIIDSYRADEVKVFAFVEEEGADEQVKQALAYFTEKIDFKGDMVASSKPSKQGKNYFFVSKEPQEPLFGEGW